MHKLCTNCTCNDCMTCSRCFILHFHAVGVERIVRVYMSVACCVHEVSHANCAHWHLKFNGMPMPCFSRFFTCECGLPSVHEVLLSCSILDPPIYSNSIYNFIIIPHIRSVCSVCWLAVKHFIYSQFCPYTRPCQWYRVLVLIILQTHVCTVGRS